MFFRNQTALTHFTVHAFRTLAIVVLFGFSWTFVSAQSSQSSTNVSPAQIGFKYQEIKALNKKLINQNNPKELEKLIEKSSDFVASFPQYKRVDEVYYILGSSLVELGRVEEGIKVFEKVIKTYPEARKVEPSLLGLGLAYDKLGKHDKADEAYTKLIEHPKFGSRSHAKIAKNILEQDKTTRKGELRNPFEIGSRRSEWLGKPAPDFKVKDLTGKELSLAQFRGQVVLLDFWATWCPPCIAEIPNVKQTYEKYKDQKFQIIGISLDRAKLPLETFIEKEGLAWRHYWDNGGKISNQYKVTGIPSTFLIDGEGVIRQTDLIGARLETAVAELVKDNLTIPAVTSTKAAEPKSIPATKILKNDTPTSNGEDGEGPNLFGSRPSEWIGQRAPNFKVTDLKGQKLSLKDYRGQVVLLDFWATWCPPCIAEMPKIKQTYEKYKDQKFQIISISLDRKILPLETYVEKEGLAWRHYWDENRKVRTQYGIKAIPTAFLIDGEGIIQQASLGPFDVETAVTELVEENLAKPANPASTEKTLSDTPSDKQTVDPKVKEIIDAAVAAHGGLEKLQAVKNIVIESQSFEHFPDGTTHNEGRNKTYYYPNKLRDDWHIDDSVVSIIYDGKTLYQLKDGESKPIPGEAVKSFVDFLKDSLFREPIWLLTNLSQNDIPVQYLGTEKIKDVSTSVLLVTQPSGRDLKIFISDETHYVVQFNYSFEIGRETENKEILFENYRDVDGIKIAHKRTTKRTVQEQILITDIKLNTEIDEALFSPKESNE